MSIKTLIYMCTNCGNVHDNLESATDCCPSVQVIDGFICSKCDSVYINKEEVDECCKNQKC